MRDTPDEHDLTVTYRRIEYISDDPRILSRECDGGKTHRTFLQLNLQKALVNR